MPRALSVLFFLACSAGERPPAASDDRPADGGVLLELSAGGDSLGPIGATTPFDSDSLATLFPGAEVVARERSAEGQAYATYGVELAGVPLLEVRSTDGSGIQSVEISAPLAAGPLAELLGRRFEVVFDGVADPDCSAGMEEDSGWVLCRAPFSAAVTLALTGSYDGPDGELPPRDVLAGWVVGRVVWRP